MTVEGRLKFMMLERGMFPHQADAVLDAVKASASAVETMNQRWGEPEEAYPQSLIAVLWLAVNDAALAYIDSTIPQAWFRPLFVSGPV